MLAVCTQSHAIPACPHNAHLICMVICPTRAVSYVEIAAIGQFIVFAEQDLLCNESWSKACSDRPTASLEPGSLAVASCSSLYFWNAGPSLSCTEGSSIVSAFISLTTSASSPGGAPPMNADAISVVFDMIVGNCHVRLEVPRVQLLLVCGCGSEIL
jgi:hypothetical protein